MAVKFGLADPAAVIQQQQNELPLDMGRQHYMEYVGRARVAGGVRPSSVKRYKAIFDKFLAYARSQGLTTWNQVTTKTILDYASHLEAASYAYRTQYLELTTLKQTVLWFVKTKRLPSDRRIDVPLTKPQGTDTYCWKPEEVQAMLEHCARRPELRWMRSVILTLATTGLRISELAGLRWCDVDLHNLMIRLVDETSSGRVKGKTKATVRTIKSGRGRTFPIQEDLLPLLRQLPRHNDGFVMHGPKGGRLKADTVRVILIRDVLKVLSGRFPSSSGQVGFVDGRLHSFRHFFCSLCANRGVAQQVVMRWLGHSESRMVEHYYHLYDEEARRQMGRIRLFEKAGDDVAAG
jgi:integrase